jgi:hypothetical protein
MIIKLSPTVFETQKPQVPLSLCKLLIQHPQALLLSVCIYNTHTANDIIVMTLCQVLLLILARLSKQLSDYEKRHY